MPTRYQSEHSLKAKNIERTTVLKVAKCFANIEDPFVGFECEDKGVIVTNAFSLSCMKNRMYKSILQKQHAREREAQAKIDYVLTNDTPSRKDCFSNSLTKEHVDSIYEFIKNHPLYHWHQALGYGICVYRAVLMRAMAETMCSLMPKASGALAFINFQGLDKSSKSSRKMNRRGYYASQYRPFYMNTSNGFRIPLRGNMLSLLNSIRIPHVALCANVKGIGPMVIDPAYTYDSISDGPLSIKEWIKQLIEQDTINERIEHGYVSIQPEWSPWTMSHLYLLTNGEALLDPNTFMSVPTLEHVINVLTMYRLMVTENQPPTNYLPSPEEVNAYFRAFIKKCDAKEEFITYMDNVAKYVENLGDHFPPPGPAPLLSPPDPVYFTLSEGDVMITHSFT
ncbi:hypothetical protein I4U23_004158 [Adineta vaga]|nr:hypothetical protein I4U23_004158 [Adineta vaga]